MASLAALTTAACGGTDSQSASSSAPPTTQSGQPATLGVANNDNLGKILDDRQGRTVYLFQKDSGTTSACTGACASAWPPVRVRGKPTVGTGATGSLLGTTSRSDGEPQVTYNGHPVYTFTGDKSPGDANGQAATAFGGGWFALSPAGDQISAPAPTAAAPGTERVRPPLIPPAAPVSGSQGARYRAPQRAVTCSGDDDRSVHERVDVAVVLVGPGLGHRDGL